MRMAIHLVQVPKKTGAVFIALGTRDKGIMRFDHAPHIQDMALIHGCFQRRPSSKDPSVADNVMQNCSGRLIMS